MNDPLKILVVGGGSAGVRHFRYLTEYGAVCSICDPADTCRVTKDFPEAERIPNFGETDLSRFDAVVICTPPNMHVHQASTAARAGCHVLLEKPLSVLNEDGIDELQDILRQTNLLAAVAFPYANMKAMDRIIEIVNAEEIGKVRAVAIHHGQNILKYRPDFLNTYYADDAQGGGCLQDDAMHPLMGLEMLFGPEEEVTCQRHSVGIKGQNVTADDTAWLWVRYGSEVIAEINFSLACHWKHNEWIINGSQGAIKFLVDELSVHVFNAQTEHIRTERFDDGWNETFRRNDANFLSAIRGKTEARCTIEMSRINLRAVLAARKSAKIGRAVRLDEL